MNNALISIFVPAPFYKLNILPNYRHLKYTSSVHSMEEPQKPNIVSLLLLTTEI